MELPESLHEKFIRKLESKYGLREELTASFGNAAYGKIAEDLCVSSSQFTKLVSGVATEGTYLRTIKNIERLQKYDKLKKDLKNTIKERDRLSSELQATANDKTSNWKFIAFLSLLVILLGGFLGGKFLSLSAPDSPANGQEEVMVNSFSRFFERGVYDDFDSPFLDESAVQRFCPCSGFEGKWELANPYCFPLPGSRKPGIYYVAREADVYFKCSKILNTADDGTNMLGFENLLHEVWVDKKRRPFSPTYFDQETKTYTDAFLELDFENNPDFEKVAYVHSFFVDQFSIYPDSIVRKGEPCGRYADVINEELAEEFELDLRHILTNVVGNMTQTICHSAVNDFCDPNDLKAGKSVIDFNCIFSIKTENLGIGGGYPYTKSYRLVKQNYSDNLLCNCEE